MEYAVYLDINVTVKAKNETDALKKGRKKFEKLFKEHELPKDKEAYLIEPL